MIPGHHWITILTAMFMHGSWSHILGNMVFLWAFGPEIEDAMNPVRYFTFYIAEGLLAMLAQIALSPSSTVHMELLGACTPKMPRKRIQLQTST
jgi:membrane associated rhomboid family serine protease